MKSKTTATKALLSSAISLVLCCAMLLGTTMAWFTATVESNGHEIYIGILDIDLLNGDISLKNNTTTKLFNDVVRWEPNATAIEELTVVNKGDLAFKYQLIFNCSDLVKKASDQFEVWVKTGSWTVTGTKYEDLTAANGWTKLGSLTEVLSGKPVFTGTMIESRVTAADPAQDTYTVALHLKKEATGEGLMGQRFNINVKLEATQLTSEADAFGPEYDEDAALPVYSLPAQLPEAGETPVDIILKTKAEDNALISTVKIPATAVENIANEAVKSVAVSHTAPICDTAANTVTFENFDLVDENGDVIDLEAMGNTTPITVVLSVGDAFAAGETVVVYHDDEAIAYAVVAEDKTITYTTTHFCRVDVNYVNTSWYDSTKTEFVISTADELAGLAYIVNSKQDSFLGKTVKLAADIDLNNVEWTPIGIGSVGDEWIGFNGSFDGQGHTVSNFKITKGGGWNGLFGLIGRGTSKYTEVVSNLTVKNVVIEGANRMSGGIVGQLYGNIENCHVENVTISAAPNKAGDSYDNGDKIGGIVGWHGDNNNNHYIKNCSATDVTLKAYRDVGGITGYVAYSAIVEECAVKDIDITVDQITNHYGVKDANAGDVVGRINQPATVQNNTAENTSFKFNMAASTYTELMATKGYESNYVLTEDMTADNIIYFGPVTANLDLGDAVVTAGNPGQYLFGAQEGKLIIDAKESVVNAGKGFMTSNSGEIVINGGTYHTTVTGTLNNIKHTSLAQNNSKIVINGGVFTTDVVDAVLFFATSNARIEINGGFFENTADDTPDLLGMGTNKSNTNRIVITGGTFVNYNPLEDRMCYTGTWPEGGEAQFGGPWMLIPGDYTVVSEAQANGDVWYSVVAK